ncbi:MAG: hypothetical protein WC648_00200 [Candidatus Paceibacterota bacterium]
MHENINITNKNWNPQNLVCGYIAMSAFHGELATGRDVSNIPLS